MILLLAHPPATEDPIGGGTLAAYITLAGTALTILVSVINALSQRRTRRERAAAVAETEAKTQVVTQGEPVQWRNTDHQALLDERAYSEKLGKELKEVQKQNRELLDKGAEQDRRIDALVEDLRQLRQSLAACPGGPICPLRPAAAAE